MNKISKPSFQEVAKLYERRFCPNYLTKMEDTASIKIVNMKEQEYKLPSDNIKSQNQPFSISDEQTYDDSAENLQKRQENKSEDFENFSYNSQDFNILLNELEQEQGQNDETEPSYKQINGNSQSGLKKRKKERKIRTTITKERLEEMNRIFKQFQDEKDKGRTPSINLKEIGVKLQLGYSTILHKFRQFRQNKVVKGGALLQSLQKKRKYAKSMDVEKYIQKALRERPLYSAVDVSKHIFRTYKKLYSRSIISRHLAEMGYSFNNIKQFPIQKNASRYIQVRKIFAKIMESYVDDDSRFIYIDQVAFSKNLFSRYFTNFVASAQEKRMNEKQQDYVSVIISATKQKVITYQIKDGFLEKSDFIECINQTAYILDRQKMYVSQIEREYLLLTDLHKIHYDTYDSPNSQKVIDQTIKQSRMRRFFLPPGSPQLNPLQSLFSTIRERLNKEAIQDQQTLREKLITVMKAIKREPTQVYFKELKIWLMKAKIGDNF